MTDSFVTQCPHCQTSFRVSHTQLSVARGVVRCGNCLQVFNAARQLLEQQAANKAAETEQPPAPLSAPAANPPAPAISQREWRAAELDLDHLDLDEELARLEQREIQPITELKGPARRDTGLSASRDGDEPPLADDLFGSPADEPPVAAVEASHPPAIDDEPVDHEPAQGERTEPSLSLDSNDFVDEPRRVHGAHDDEPDLPGDRLSAHDPLHADDEASPVEQERQEPALGAVSGRPARKEPLLDLVDDPLQLDWQKPRSSWGRRLLWSLLILLAASGLAAQYIAYHFDELARQDQYRPWFQQLCPQLGCSVPSKVDIARIKSSNLVVRSHPDFTGALIVDAIIYNRAPFSQPFPLLELRFADLNGQLIASRRFKPAEYLSGELAGKGEMPSQTPIHIALDILDPGPKAVNYSLSFRSPE